MISYVVKPTPPPPASQTMNASPTCNKVSKKVISVARSSPTPKDSFPTVFNVYSAAASGSLIGLTGYMPASSAAFIEPSARSQYRNFEADISDFQCDFFGFVGPDHRDR